MQQEWTRKVVENVLSEDLLKARVQDFSPNVTYASAIASVGEKRKTEPHYLFTDEEFVPDQSSLIYTEKGKNKLPPGIHWKRTNQLAEMPSFMKDGYSRDDVVQGKLGDCYFLSGLASLAERYDSLRKVILKNQSVTPDPKYLGVFHFRFWQFGTWYDVVIDDWLPCIEDKNKKSKVAYGHSSDSNEFWIVLAEKAYAKLYGSYEAINGGLTMEALEDLTGGISVRYDLKKEKTDELMLRMRKAVRSGNFVSLAVAGGGYDLVSGLQGQHSYSVTLSEKITVDGEKVDLFRIRNPWGLGYYEWKLDWSDKSEKWKLVSEKDKKRLRYPAGDGEWFMSSDDILKYMDSVTICSKGPDFDEDGSITNDGYFYSYAQGQWVWGENAAGPFHGNSLRNFFRNPQYLIKLATDVSEPVSAYVSLMQRYTRPQREGRFKFNIGHRLYEINPALASRMLRTKSKVQPNSNDELKLAHPSDDCKPQRGVSLAFEIEKEKSYLYLPFTGKEGQEEDFLIRVYSEEKISLVELN